MWSGRGEDHMNILLSTIFDYPHAGGLSTHVTTLKSGLEKRGHSVDIVSFSQMSKFGQIGIVRGPGFLINKVFIGRGLLWGWWLRSSFITREIRRQNKQYDIINAQDPYATSASIRAGIAPVVTTLHGYMTYEVISCGQVKEGSRTADYLMRVENNVYGQTEAIITVDQRIKDYIHRETGIEATKIMNFIDVDAFKPEKEKKEAFRKQHSINVNDKILFVPRRLTKKNGVIYPALALKAVIGKYPQVKLIYAGSGEDLGAIKKIVHEQNLHQHVTMLGAISHDLMKEYYTLSDVVLVPSVHTVGVEEATSISALEALGSGCPLIASAVGGLKEIVSHGEDGLLVKDKDVAALSKAIISLFDQPSWAEDLARQGRKKIERDYSHLTAARKYEEIYLNTLQQHKR